MKKRSRIVVRISLVIFLVLAALLFVPRNYEVLEFTERPGTQYWELPTGSKIGYFKVKAHAKSLKPPIIYLHGGPGGRVSDGSIAALKPLAAYGNDLYFYDQVGSGHSERLAQIEEYSVARHRSDLKAIISEMEAEKVILIAHSWGSLLAINFLQHYPEKVEKLIISGPGPILPIKKSLAKISPPDSLNIKEPSVSNAEGNRKVNNLRMRLVWRWAYKFKSKLAPDAEADDFFTLLNQELNKSTACEANESQAYPGGSGYYSHIMTLKSFEAVEDQREKLKSLALPILILRGQCDNQKWGYTQEYLELLPNVHLEIFANSGHDVTRGNEEQYLEKILNFIAENTSNLLLLDANALEDLSAL